MLRLSLHSQDVKLCRTLRKNIMGLQRRVLLAKIDGILQSKLALLSFIAPEKVLCFQAVDNFAEPRL